MRQKRGFTLIELVMVITIIGILATVVIGAYGSLQKTSSEKVSLANQEALLRTVLTFNALNGNRGPDYLDALIDYSTPAGTAGTTGTTAGSTEVDGVNSSTAVGGIYRGVKFADVSGTAASASSKAQNVGLSSSLYTQLDVYYLSANAAQYLKDLGLTTVLYHNYTSNQATALGASTTVSGGPGFRVESSACVPVPLAAGVAVLVVDPYKGSQIYKGFGQDLTQGGTVTVSDRATGWTQAAATGGVLLIFGLGNNSTIVGNKNGGIADAPRSEILNYTYYRQYFLVYRMPGSPNMLSGEFVGVIDPKGQTIYNARFANDWRNGTQ